MKRYDDKFKEYAVWLSETNSVLNAAWELNVSPSSIYRWRKAHFSMEKDKVWDKNRDVPEKRSEMDAYPVPPFFLWWCFV